MVRLFYSYSHFDEAHLNDFITHTSLLENNGLVQGWHDRKIIPGQNIQDEIDESIDATDVFCLFISPRFLASAECQKEKDKILKLKAMRGIAVVSIILSDCAWLDDVELSKHLALPQDGKPIVSFEYKDKGWQQVYEGLKKVINQEIKLRKISIKPTFEEVLQNAEMLSKAHAKKEKVKLEDIFVYPILDKHNELGEYEENISSQKLMDMSSFPKNHSYWRKTVR